MRDKRPVDELSVDELERILAVKRREERMNRFRRQNKQTRTVGMPTNGDNLPAVQGNNKPVPAQHERAVNVPSPTAPVTYDTTPETPRFEDEMVDETLVYVSEEPTFIDEVEKPKQIDRRPKEKIEAERTMRQRLMSWALLAMEVILIGGLAIILYNAFTGLEAIQDNTNRTQAELDQAIAQGRFTPTPTPILAAGNYLLPGGHVPPDENGLSAPNLLEVESYVPENIRPAVARQLIEAPSFLTVEADNVPIAIDIPSIGISNASIVPGDHWEFLKAGIGYRPGSGLAGSNQNMVLTGHNDVYGEVFRELPELNIGDEIRIRDSSGRVHTYRVSDMHEVEPNRVEFLDPNLGAQVTLITCYPYRVNNKRWIVEATLVQ